MAFGREGAGFGRGGALGKPGTSSPPPTYTPALKFNDARNSQYAPVALGA